jgi:hypothetical protein
MLREPGREGRHPGRREPWEAAAYGTRAGGGDSRPLFFASLRPAETAGTAPYGATVAAERPGPVAQPVFKTGEAAQPVAG